MTAPIVYHFSREHRAVLDNEELEDTHLGYADLWREWVLDTPGQLWSRVAEGRKQVWS
jgi:hypothetical protein